MSINGEFVAEATNYDITPRSFAFGLDSTRPQCLAAAMPLVEIDAATGMQHRVHLGHHRAIDKSRTACVDPLPPLAEMEKRKR